MKTINIEEMNFIVGGGKKKKKKKKNKNNHASVNTFDGTMLSDPMTPVGANPTSSDFLDLGGGSDFAGVIVR